MRAGIRLGIGLQAGFVVWRLMSFLCGLLMLPALGLILVGQYIEASVLVCVAIAVPRGLWWLCTRRRRAA
jgi:hypothetical protein